MKKRNLFNSPIWLLEIEYERELRSATTYKNYVRSADVLYDFLLFHPKKKMPADFFVVDVEDYAAKIKAARTEGAAREAKSVLRAFFNWLRERGFVMANPAVVPKRPIKRTPPPHLSVEELRALWSAAQHPLDNLIVTLALRGTPLRQIAATLHRDKSTVWHRYDKVRDATGLRRLTLSELHSAASQLAERLGREQLQSLGLLSTIADSAADDVVVAEAAH